MAAYRFIVTGRVQGVGYRYFALQEARALGITGFARNEPDGSVQVVAEGADDALQAFEGRLQEGPAFSAVSSVERTAIEARGDGGFDIR